MLILCISHRWFIERFLQKKIMKSCYLHYSTLFNSIIISFGEHKKYFRTLKSILIENTQLWRKFKLKTDFEAVQWGIDILKPFLSSLFLSFWRGNTHQYINCWLGCWSQPPIFQQSQARLPCQVVSQRMFRGSYELQVAHGALEHILKKK